MSSNTIFDWPELRRGARACLAPAAAVFIFAFVLGALAHQRGWGLSYLVLFILGISGASVQAVAIQMWLPVNDILPLFVACFSVHLRYVLICASIEHLLSRLSFVEKLLALHFTTDSNWVVTIAEERRSKKVSAAYFFGGGLLVVACYLSGNVTGFLATDTIPDIRTLGLDFAIPGVFLCLLLSLWKSPRADLLPWGTAIAVALVSRSHIAGGWYIVLGAVSGACMAGLVQVIRPAEVDHAK